MLLPLVGDAPGPAVKRGRAQTEAGKVQPVATDRLNREQFYRTLAALDEAGLKKALWTLYWRGSASVQERIMAVIDPSSVAARAAGSGSSIDADALLSEVEEFAALARHGSYLAGDRRVSPKERTRWRFTFQRLAKTTTQALAGRDVEPAASAMVELIDLACELQSFEYFRSDDPVEAARFVVSDAAAVLWSAIRREQGYAAFCERAAGQLLRWESRWGWTRHGEGWVRARETTLARVVAGMLPTADAWGQFADHYLRALDSLSEPGRGTGERRRLLQGRKDALSTWHDMLRERLAHGEFEDRLDMLARHPALSGSPKP